jgi:tetratricopeptide (TPR) repeat protein
MRKYALAAAGAAVAFGLCGGTANAFSLVVGGLGGACYAEVKAGHFTRDALDLCSRALQSEYQSDHDIAGTHVNRGAIELYNKDYEAAHADFAEAMKIEPSMGEAYVGEGAYLISMERYADAEPLLSRGIDLGVEEPEKGYYFRGISRWGQDNFKGAYLDFTKASELKPGWTLPREQLTHFHVEQR